MQREQDAGKVKASSDYSIDISQISGPDGRSKPTSLSQIGFWDPASVGCGQQLTLLSIEVCLVLLSTFLSFILYNYCLLFTELICSKLE